MTAAAAAGDNAGAADLTARCACGRVRITLPRLPDRLLRCNCTLCTKTGWHGAYFASNELVIEGAFDGFVRTDLAEPMIRLLRCRTCGIMTHWEPLTAPPHARMGVNANLLDPETIAGIEVEQVDGRSWDG